MGDTFILLLARRGEVEGEEAVEDSRCTELPGGETREEAGERVIEGLDLMRETTLGGVWVMVGRTWSEGAAIAICTGRASSSWWLQNKSGDAGALYTYDLL